MHVQSRLVEESAPTFVIVKTLEARAYENTKPDSEVTVHRLGVFAKVTTQPVAIVPSVTVPPKVVELAATAGDVPQDVATGAVSLPAKSTAPAVPATCSLRVGFVVPMPTLPVDLMTIGAVPAVILRNCR